MVRQHTLLSQRLIPHSPRQQKPQRFNYRPTQPARSPIAAKFHHSKILRTPPRGSSRYARSRPTLPTIQEEDEGEDSRQHLDLYHQLDTYGRQDKRNVRNEDEEMMEWDEETTLVALFQDDVNEADDEADIVALAEKLKAPMSAQSQQLKQYMADTVLPAITQVKQVHDTLEDELDMAYGTGLLAFDEVCKRVEALALRTEDEVKTTYLESQKSMNALMGELAEAYRFREQLWIDLEEKLGDCAERAKAAIGALPSDVEDTIARLEKKCKDMEKNSNSAASKQKMLKGLLEHL